MGTRQDRYEPFSATLVREIPLSTSASLDLMWSCQGRSQDFRSKEYAARSGYAPGPRDLGAGHGSQRCLYELIVTPVVQTGKVHMGLYWSGVVPLARVMVPLSKNHVPQ